MLHEMVSLFRLRRETSRSAEEAMRVLECYIRNNHPDLEKEYMLWFTQRRNINVAGFTRLINKSLCDLEGGVFDEHKKQVSFFAGAAARVADDLIDTRTVAPEEVYLLNSNENNGKDTPSLRLFHALDNGLESLLPQNFRSDFKNVIKEFNQAQGDSVRLLDEDVSLEDLVSIRDRVGGYSVLLLYGFVFPEEGDLSEGLAGSYDPNGSLPETKAEALYNFGAWLSRTDDLWDMPYDKRIGMKQLATEGCVTWSSLKQETKYTLEGLGLYYPEEKVRRFRETYRPATSRVISMLF